MKKIEMIKDHKGVASTTIKEICLLKDLEHINIIKLYKVIHWNKRFYLIFELADCDLKILIKNRKK